MHSDIGSNCVICLVSRTKSFSLASENKRYPKRSITFRTAHVIVTTCAYYLTQLPQNCKKARARRLARPLPKEGHGGSKDEKGVNYNRLFASTQRHRHSRRRADATTSLRSALRSARLHQSSVQQRHL